jgi:hypothetical protein
LATTKEDRLSRARPTEISAIGEKKSRPDIRRDARNAYLVICETSGQTALDFHLRAFVSQVAVMAEARPRRRSSIGERARSVSDALASDALGDRWPAEGQATAAAPAPPSPIIEAPAPKGLFFTGDPEKDHDMANLVLLSIILALDGCYCLALALANDDGATATRLFGAFVVASRREEEKRWRRARASRPHVVRATTHATHRIPRPAHTHAHAPHSRPARHPRSPN